MSDLVLVSQEGAVAVLTLNRPERHNSLVPPLLRELLGALKGIRSDPGTRAVVLQANGRSFSTGGDLGGFREHIKDLESYAYEIVGLLNETILALIRLPVPVVAGVQGTVTGGSLGLAMASDIVLVAEEASFTPYYSVVGFSPDGGWTAMLPDIIGLKRTAEILMRNLTISAQQAVGWGLANRLVPKDLLCQAALSTAIDLGARKQGSLRHTKELLNRGGRALEERLEAERRRFVEQIGTEEARNGIESFLASRQALPAPRRDMWAPN
jgi:enoyl-CoA hydratase/carnithine racemase